MLDQGIQELADESMITLNGTDPIVITAKGRATIAALTEARRAGLEDLLDGWNPKEHPELEALVRQLAGVLLADDDKLVKAATPSSEPS